MHVSATQKKGSVMYKSFANLAVCGHSQHGKSTLIGHLAILREEVSASRAREAEKQAHQVGEDSYKYAYLMHSEKADDTDYSHTFTQRPQRVQFNVSDERRVTVIDTPGHYMWLKNMVWGLFQADYAMLVVAANEGIKPQTVDVLHILKYLGIKLVGVAVDKLDLPIPDHYSQSRFDDMVEEARQAIETVDVERCDVKFIPVSGLTGEGLVAYKEIDWYQGPTVYDVIRSIGIQRESLLGPLRFVFQHADLFHVPGRGPVAIGTVESGTLSVGDRLVFEPISTITGEKVVSRVRGLHLPRGLAADSGEDVDEAKSRQLVSVLLDSGVNWQALLSRAGRGSICGHENAPPRVASSIRAMVSLVSDPRTHVTLRRMSAPTIHPNVAQASGTFLSIYRKRAEGKDWTSHDVHLVAKGEQAEVELGLSMPVALEEVSEIPSLSKFLIRANREIVGAGQCVEITG